MFFILARNIYYIKLKARLPDTKPVKLKAYSVQIGLAYVCLFVGYKNG